MSVNKYDFAGYNVHFRRLKDINGQASFFRTHKYKFAVEDATIDSLGDAISEVSSVVDSTTEGSLLWFLTQMLGLGFCVAQSPEYKRNILRELDDGYESSFELQLIDILSSLPKAKSKLVKNPSKLVDYLLKGKRNSVEQLDRFESGESKILPTFIADFLEIFEVEYVDLDQHVIVNNLVMEIVQDCKKNGNRGMQNRIKKILEEFFDTSFNFGSDKTTFFFNPLMLGQVDLKISEYSIYDVLFKNIIPTANFLSSEYDSKELMGTANNQVGLSNFLNASVGALSVFRRGLDSTKELIRKQNPKLFDNNLELLDNLASRVVSLVDKLPEAKKSDYLMHSWYKYRNLIGGRLEGWTTSFLKRIDEYESYLSDTVSRKRVEQFWSLPDELVNWLFEWDGDEKGFRLSQDILSSKKVFDNVDFLDEYLREKLFSSDVDEVNGEVKGWTWNKKYGLGKDVYDYFNAQKNNHRELFKVLEEGIPVDIWPMKVKRDFDLLKELRPKAVKLLRGEDTSDNLGELLNRYVTYLQSVREYLARLSNEGIPKDIYVKGIKKSIGLKNTDYVINEELVMTKKKGVVVDNENVNIIGFLKKSYVPKELQRYPRFIGEAKKNPKEEIEGARRKLLSYAVAGQELCQKVFENSSKDQKFSQIWVDYLFESSLESLRKIGTKMRNSSFILGFLRKFIDERNLSDMQNNLLREQKLESLRFYLSGYEYGDWEKLPVKDIGFEDFVGKFVQYFAVGKPVNQLKTEKDFEQYFEFSSRRGAGKNTVLRGELLKFYWSLLLKKLPNDVRMVAMDEDNLSVLKENKLWDLINDTEVKRSDLQRFVQAGIGADVRAKITILSRNKFVERSVLQIENGGQNCLRYVPIEWGDFSHLDKRSTKKIKHKLKANKRLDNIGFSEKALNILKKKGLEGPEKLSNIAIAEWIWEQKIDRDLIRVLGEMPHRWEVVLLMKEMLPGSPTIETGLFFDKSSEKKLIVLNTRLSKEIYAYNFPIETSVVQKQFLERFLWGDKEDNLNIAWQGSSLIMEKNVLVNWNDDKASFDVEGVDFYLAIPFQISKEGKKKKNQKYRNTDSLLGIDLGEYGFGWAVFDEDSEEFVKSGFTQISLLAKLRDEAASWKDTQARGVFGSPQTYLAELREQATGQIRNQIHALALKYNAKPIYEDSVDAFESGGQRISKLYKTLKVSDVIKGGSTEADKQVRRHVWGVDFINTGAEIGASKTSQTCRKCGRCATSDLYSLEGKMKVKDGKINNLNIKVTLDDGEHDRKFVMLNIKKNQRAEGKSGEGSQSVFRCQYLDCENETHADEQAARNIALKYFLKQNADEQGFVVEPPEKYRTKSGYFSSLKYFLEESKKSWKETEPK